MEGEEALRQVAVVHIPRSSQNRRCQQLNTMRYRPKVKRCRDVLGEKSKSTGDCKKYRGTCKSVRAYTYGISTVGGVLDLGLMQLHLLLCQERLHFRVFLMNNFQ